jgi:hypothetical protein
MSETIKDSLLVTKECVRGDILDANIYHSLMFKWVNGLVAVNGFERAFDGMFHWIRDALETKYIFAMAKIFARSNEAGLWRFIQQAKAYSQDAIDLKLERVHDFLKDSLRNQRQEFLKNFDTYEKKIKEISEVIEPYRNVQRAHNLPWRQNGGKEVTWDTTKRWLDFAEQVFVQTVDGICESCCRVGEFFPSELNGQMDYFTSLLKESIESKSRNV